MNVPGSSATVAEMEPRTQELVAEFERVTLRFGDEVALRDVSFQLERGETKIVLGAAGSGKSVLLKLTMGLLRADEGQIRVLGTEITHQNEEALFELRRNIGMVFQEGALFDSLTVGENVGYVFDRMKEVSAEEVERRVREALEFVELGHTYDQFPSQLSGGMRRRVAIARALVGQPDLVLYDSPTAGLDPITAARIMALIVRQREARQVSSLPGDPPGAGRRADGAVLLRHPPGKTGGGARRGLDGGNSAGMDLRAHAVSGAAGRGNGVSRVTRRIVRAT